VKVYVASPLGFALSTKLFMDKELMPAIIAAEAEPLNPWDAGSEVENMILDTHTFDSLALRKISYSAVINRLGKANVDLIKQSSGLVAVLDGVDIDSGTAAEIGYATALGLWTVGLRTDFRRSGEDQTAECNLQVEYFIRMNGGVIVHNLVEMQDELRKRIA
jgi:nucleoside 2-deoxyribosyltransferase